MKKKILLLLASSLFLAGCSQGDAPSSSVNESSSEIPPVSSVEGSISEASSFEASSIASSVVGSSSEEGTDEASSASESSSEDLSSSEEGSVSESDSSSEEGSVSESVPLAKRILLRAALPNPALPVGLVLKEAKLIQNLVISCLKTVLRTFPTSPTWMFLKGRNGLMTTTPLTRCSA